MLSFDNASKAAALRPRLRGKRYGEASRASGARWQPLSNPEAYSRSRGPVGEQLRLAGIPVVRFPDRIRGAESVMRGTR